MMAVWAERIERIECSNVIVVEGKEDKLFFEALQSGTLGGCRTFR